MNTFTASNGYKVTPNGDGVNVYRGIMSTPIYPDEMQALREFFQAESDERAGRWRWVEHPDYVVYDTGDRIEVVVLDESTGCMENVWRGKERPGSYMHDAARAYFEAHPEPKGYVIIWSGGLTPAKPQTLPEAQVELKRSRDMGEIFRLVPLDVAGEEQ